MRVWRFMRLAVLFTSHIIFNIMWGCVVVFNFKGIRVYLDNYEDVIGFTLVCTCFIYPFCISLAAICERLWLSGTVLLKKNFLSTGWKIWMALSWPHRYVVFFLDWTWAKFPNHHCERLRKTAQNTLEECPTLNLERLALTDRIGTDLSLPAVLSPMLTGEEA